MSTKHVVSPVKVNRYDEIATVRGTIKKQGENLVVESPNLWDNLLISTGIPFRLEYI